MREDIILVDNDCKGPLATLGQVCVRVKVELARRLWLQTTMSLM